MDIYRCFTESEVLRAEVDEYERQRSKSDKGVSAIEGIDKEIGRLKEARTAIEKFSGDMDRLIQLVISHITY